LFFKEPKKINNKILEESVLKTKAEQALTKITTRTGIDLVFDKWLANFLANSKLKTELASQAKLSFEEYAALPLQDRLNKIVILLKEAEEAKYYKQATQSDELYIKMQHEIQENLKLSQKITH